MIYITAGHAQGIGLEVFLKALPNLPSRATPYLCLLTDQKPLQKQLRLLQWPYHLEINKSLALSPASSRPLSASSSFCLTSPRFKIKLQGFLLDTYRPKMQRSSAMLHFACAQLKLGPGDILFTLPTSKDQLFYHHAHLGHTEWLRSFYQKPNISMNFKADHDQLLLITDHVPLAQVAKKISSTLIVQRVTTSLAGWKKYFTPIKEVYLAGINPHAGEQGLLGQEDQVIRQAIQQLRRRFPQIKFQGPLPGDTMLRAKNKLRAAQQLWVFMYHDQGLTWFKHQHDLAGINLSFGLPYLRLSVDHGTAFDLYGKNQASPVGVTYVLQTAFKIQQRLIAKNKVGPRPSR
ncbi:MAG: 4-hydroxythreonine-4-phosphate dehydrogenase PdxA [Bacteriovoracaceae bacterium]|nr:4-hydroxythreonine-4-phosphate dehydrogenase PdxA [Bacteriovoracaceae bacterium]